MFSIGDLINGHYSIVKPAIIGDFGNIYQAFDVRSKNMVAIKEINPKKIGAEEERERSEAFDREIEFLKLHPHENLVYFVDGFHVGGSFYYVTEWVDGVNLEAILRSKNRPFKGKDILRLFYALIDLVSYLESRKPAYNLRFLRPSDIVIDSDGVARVIDTGIAMDLQPFKQPEEYVIPDEEYGEPLDIFFVGATIYELVTGIKPGSVAPGGLPPADKVNPEVPKSLANIITLCMAPRGERYKGVNVVKRDLERFFPEYSPSTHKSGEKTLEEEMSEKEQYVALGNMSCLFALLILGIIIFGLYHYKAEITRGYHVYRLKECEESIRKINTALEAYKKSKAHYPDKLDKLKPKFIKEIPTCPMSKSSDQYMESYTLARLGKEYYFCCKGHHHKGAGLPEDYPRYSSIKGLVVKPEVQTTGAEKNK